MSNLRQYIKDKEMDMQDKENYWRCKSCSEIYYWVNDTYCPVCEDKPLKKEMISLDDLIEKVKKEMKGDNNAT